uniref:Protein Vpu n=1 Tax=Human immunodeficiency virus type 1 TaxID=11676 RepID=A0A517EPW8_HV1|nr:vpu protein [Human immunodeficiency virus 1]
MWDLLAKADYKLGVGALVIAAILVIVVWILVYIEYRKVLKQRKIDSLIKRIRERAEDSGNESDGDIEELSTMVDMGHLRLLDGNEL